jgi:hypothetical protein
VRGASGPIGETAISSVHYRVRSFSVTTDSGRVALEDAGVDLPRSVVRPSLAPRRFPSSDVSMRPTLAGRDHTDRAAAVAIAEDVTDRP